MNNTTGNTTSPSQAAAEPGLVFVVLACLLLAFWLLFLGFYFSRFSGLILTWFFNKFLIPKDAYLRIGSFSISVLSGKLMFRDVLYVTKDLTFRVVDGYAIFHWWQTYIPENDVERNKSSSCRLTVSLNGFEFHVYNRSDLYDRLQDLYKKDRYGDAHKSSENLNEDQNVNETLPDRHGKYLWRDLIPTIKIDINSGKVAFGNKMVETTLCFHFESAAATYRVTKPGSLLDQFAHKVCCDCKNVRVLLAPSNGYTGDRDVPPRYMGEGFVVLQSQICKVTYLQDEPGLVPEINTEDESVIETDPCWNLDVTFEKSTSFSYGPWADRQREQLQKFFFPFDYQEQIVSKALAPGQRREHSGLDIRFDFQCDSTLDLLFTKDQETQAVHVCVGAGSYAQIYQPWRVHEYGYMSSVVAHLQQVEASTSLEFRQFLEAEDMKVTVNMTIPRIWNHTQHWSADIMLNKATWFFIFTHKFFFQDLANDWSTKNASELLSFIPYEWALNICLRDFEMIWMANEYNWIDCSTIWQENTEFALCGESLDLSFVLSYTTFLPEIEETKFVIQVERLIGRLNIPESSTLRRSLLSLAQEEDPKTMPGVRSSTSANVDQEGHDSADEQTSSDCENGLSGGWRRHTNIKNGWIDVLSAPLLSVIITYIYHPIVPGETFQDIQERCRSYGEQVPELYTDLEADVINLEVDANSCAFKLIGIVLKALGNIKENYFGAYQIYKEFDARGLSKIKRTATSEDVADNAISIKDVDPLSLRPMEANILVNMGSVRAELTQHSSSEDVAVPLLVTDRLTFEMHKNFSETRLQLQLTPTTIFTNDVIKSASTRTRTRQGYLHLSGLQLRGHAMFSAEDRPIDVDTLEYAWLVELQLGTFSGKVTPPQLLAVSNWAELFFFHLLDEENQMKDPTPHKLCQHGVLQSKCEKRPNINESFDSEGADITLCRTEDDFKYKITRVSVEKVDVCLVEASCCCNVKISPIRLASCNLHTESTKTGVSVLVHKIDICQYVLLLAGNKIKNQVGQEEACWLEAASLHAGPIVSDICLEEDTCLNPTDQKEFLEKHDKKTRRLWFLWQRGKKRASRSIENEGRCGCVGGCNFFGKNVNGPNFFKLDYLDAAQEENEGRLFGSPDGWQNNEFDEDDDAFLENHGNPKTIQRNNSWAGRSQSPKFRRINSQRSTKKFRSKGDTSRSKIPAYATFPTKANLKVFSGKSARSVPDNFQKAASSNENERRGTSDEESEFDRQRFPSDASSFYSCTSGFSLPSRPASVVSLDSFTSAVDTREHPLFEVQCDDFQERFILLPSVLLSKYKSHLPQMQCEQWIENEYLTTQASRKFNLVQNLKSIDHIPRTCPKRLEFVRLYTGQYHTLLSRRITDSPDVFKPSVFTDDVQRRPGLKRDTSITENDSDKIPGKMDSLKRRRWKTEINNEKSQSISSSKRLAAGPASNIEPGQLSRGTSIVRIEGFVNIMLSPLLLEALNRYSKSVDEQINSLHPCTIFDKIHVKSLNVAKKKYKMDVPDISLKKKESQENIFISVPGVNICFLQALTSERRVSTLSLATGGSESELSDAMGVNYHPNPSLSLLAVRLNKFSGQVIVHNRRNASLAKYMHEKLEDASEDQVTSNQSIPLSHVATTTNCENVGNKLAGNFNLEQVQVQFSRLCNKSDVENSHTTAISTKCSKVDFVYSSRNIIQFSKDLNVKHLKKDEIVIFVMLESGMDNISLKVGNCAKLTTREKTKHQVVSPKKSGHNRSQSAPAQLLTKIAQCDVTDAPSLPPTLHENYSEQVLESIVVEKRPGIPMSQLSPKDDSASSITSSLSARSESTGNLTDNESEGEDGNDAQPLLARRSEEIGRVGKPLKPSATSKEEPPKPAYVLHHENDVVANFKCIWFNCASPSSVKPIPENYHLHNNLLTTGIPAVSSWMPGTEKLRATLAQLQSDHRRRYYSITSCIMALGLPEKNKMLGTHTIVSKSSKESRYLQREYSSQLIFHLRRQLVGTRKQKVLTALSDVSAIPSTEDLASGIMALSRQWKCLLGETDEEFRPAGFLKRPVVGRGVLTDRDRAILMKTEYRKSQEGETLAADFEALNASVPSPMNTLYSVSDRLSPKASSSMTSVSTSESENVPLTSKTRVKKRKPQKQEVEQSLYSWFSSPVASPRSSQPDTSLIDRQEQTVTWATPEKDEDDLFGQMVSQPTSGKQIADEKVIFKAFFLGMGFLQPSDEFSTCSEKTFSLLVKLRCLRLDISEGKLDCLRRTKVEVPQVVTSESQNNTPSFIFQNFDTKVNVKSCPLISSPKKYAEEKFYGKDKLESIPQKPLSITRSAYVKVSCSSATQSINLSLIRLLLQVTDIIDILGENYEGIKAGKVSSNDVLLNAPEKDDVKTVSENQKCWRIMSQVSDLYSTLPSGQTTLTKEGSDQLREHKIDIETTSNQFKRRQLSRTLSSPKDIRFISRGLSRDPPQLKVVVVLMLHKLKCVATLGELCLQTDMNSISFSACHKVEKQQGTLIKRASVGSLLTTNIMSRGQNTDFKAMSVVAIKKYLQERGVSVNGYLKPGLVEIAVAVEKMMLPVDPNFEKLFNLEACCRKIVSSSISAHLQKARLVLSEVGHQAGTVVSCVMNTSHGMYSSINKREVSNKSIVISLGAIDVDIPQHPVALHCMMTRSSKTLSKQLSEIQNQRSVMRTFSSLERSSLVELSRDKDEGDVGIVGDNIPGVYISKDDIDATDSGSPYKVAKDFPQMSITVVLQGFSIGASLLPSLKVEYKIGTVSSFGRTGKENSFKLDMPHHHLSFTSKVKSLDSSIPASTSIHLPRVDISGVLDQDVTPVSGKKHLKIVADIGTLNQNLSTDLLNHLIFIQRGFMKEVNDVLQRVSGESQPVPLWRTASTDNVDTDDKENVFLIFTFTLNLKGIKITATTPSSTAVRLETGSVNLEVSNNEPVIATRRESSGNVEKNDQRKDKVFVRADVDLTLSLVQFLKDQMLGDGNDFQQLAFFNTHVGIRNCLQGRDKSEEKETLVISVVKPYIYAQPVAFDKAVLLYLNYKNAYSYWNEQRMSLNEDVQFATQAVFEKLPQPHPAAQLSGFLFLQLTVSQLGICLPLYIPNQEQPLITSQGPGDINLALVLTMENMLLTCCSSASFVSKGNFTHFCLRFAEKFDVKQHDWKPQKRDGILMNSCKVPNGTYEICSRTIRQPYVSDMTKAGKMVMSLMWKMCGIDVHCDTEIGKRLKALGHTLTSVTGDSDIANLESVAEESEDLFPTDKNKEVDHEESDDECFDETDFAPRDGHSDKPQNLEKEMWKQARKVNELRRQSSIDTKCLKAETEILQELESAVFNEFRRDVKRKFEKQSQKSLFALNERRPSLTQRSMKKSHSSFRMKLMKQRSQETSGKDEIDFGKSNEMIDLGTNVATDGSTPSRFLTTAPLDTSFSSPHEQMREMRRRDKSPVIRQRRLPLVDSSEQVPRPTPKNQHSVSFSSQKSTVVQQDLDFDLEVTVNIESGKCVFHPNNEVKVEPTEPRTYAARLHEVLKTSASTGHRGRSKTAMKQQDEHPDSSVILLPGVEARVHYSSVTDSLLSFTVDSSTDSTLSSKKVGKHASLYVSLLVQPLPDEMLLRPAILDFIDKALNPIVAAASGVDEQAETKSIHSEADPATSSFISSSTSDNSSFPVDIVVVARVQPSSIRISCLPTSRVECLMRIPSLDIAYSSKPSPNKTSNKSGVRDETISSQRSQSSDAGAVHSYDSGGISFTICLSSFSLCIYHPYGKQHTVASKTTSAPEENDNLSPRARINIAQPQPISGKKDALSLCLEYIKFNLSRRRFGDVITTRKEQDKHGSQDEISTESSTLVKVSGICDFGSATFTYDMRRLQEIMDFPKCWHKRGLFSRLFLGKEGTYATKSGAAAQAGDVTDAVHKVQSATFKTPGKADTLAPNTSGHRRNMSTPLPGILPFWSSPSLLGTLPRTHSNHNKTADLRNTPSNTSGNPVFAFDDVDSPPSCSSTLSTSPTAKWETVVVLAISLSRLDVSTNMANVMGKTSWSTSDLRASGNLRLTNFGERTLRSKVSIRQSTWESRGGIAGGHVELQDISSNVNVNESRESELEHSVNVRFRYCETRIDYMGTCILMGNVSSFRIAMSDDWKTNLTNCPSSDELFKDSTCGTGHAKVTVNLHGTLHWKNMGLVICRSTTSDLIKMGNKIKTFFTEQASSSARMLSSVNYLPPLDGDAVSSLANPLGPQPVQKSDKEQFKDGLKYQHWSKVLSKISGLKSDVLASPLPQKGTVVGGTLELSCWEVSLACFHGLNFRSQTWALFSITQPSASYSSKVASVEKSCQVNRARSIQKLSFQLGTRTPLPKTTGKQDISHMGMISKVQRGPRNPPSMGSSVAEWLSYVSSVSNTPLASPGDISPPPQPLSPRSKSEGDSSSTYTRRRNKSISSGYKHEHDSEAIFGLPSFKVDVITDHDQPVRVYVTSGDKLSRSWPLQTPSSPHTVECSLESHFYDSLYVTIDVGLIFFLHEIIQAYVKENETAQAGSTTAITVKSTSRDEPDAQHVTGESESATSVSQRKKVRQFRSKSWKLEPTIRFLSWAGRRMEGVNIDWVLEKLGFEHARLTIPKWVQRGAMDPMDRFLSVLLYRLLLVVQESDPK